MELNIVSNPDDDPAFDTDPDGDAAAYSEWAAIAGESARPPAHPQRAQYTWLKTLASHARRMFVVGDDQSI